MRTLVFLSVVALMLVGCVSQPANPYGLSKQETSARNRARVHTELASGYYVRGQQAIALEEFSMATDIDPDFAPAYSGLGLVYAALNEDAKAESSFRKSLQLEPNNSESHNNYGVFLCSRDRIDESVNEFMLATKNPLYQTPETAYLNAGRCLLKKNDTKTAETYLLRALEFQPGLRQALYQLATINFGRGEYVLARERLDQAMNGIDPSPDMLWLGVRIERTLGNADVAASYGMLLKNKYPNSEQTKAYLSEKK